MKITWFGQACFELVSESGIVIICDPYHPAMGYAVHPRRADIITISHEHGDHNYTGWVEGPPEVVRGVGSLVVKGVRINGLPSFHDNEGGSLRGPNTVFVIEADGTKLCHLGDLGHAPGEELLAQIGKTDILLIPVGGYYTIDSIEAASIASNIGARLTIPMHYSTGVKDTPLEPVDSFAEAMSAQKIRGSSIEFNTGYTGPHTIVLDYLR
jgi:L-ascorbate metabolism protein UlaG (beta-lactamase superfamily)